MSASWKTIASSVPAISRRFARPTLSRSTPPRVAAPADDVGDRLQQPDERGGRHRLAAAGFAEQGEGFAAAGLEAHVVDGAHGAGDGADVDGQAVDLAAPGRRRAFGGRVFCDSGHERAFVVLVKRDRRFCGTVRRHRCPGSVAMRAQAARMVADTVVMTMARPGKNDSHHAVCR